MPKKKEKPVQIPVFIDTLHLGGETVTVEVIEHTATWALHKMPVELGKQRQAYTVTYLPTGHHVLTGIRKKTSARDFFNNLVSKADELGISRTGKIEDLWQHPGWGEFAEWVERQRDQLDFLKACIVER